MSKKDNVIVVLNTKTIKERIYEIRSQKVMLDFDLAEIYGYTTKAFNQQVKNNIDKAETHMSGKIDTNELMSDYFNMFADTEKTGLPARTGYVYGYLRVKEYLEKNNLKIKDIIDKDWKDILN